MTRAADILAARLYRAGCRYAFGMAGGEVLTLIDALEKVGIQVITVKHENTGGFIAEGVWHRSQAPAIVLATIGPGAMNAVNVVVNALQDRVPMVVLTGAIDPDEGQTYTHQILDQTQVFRPITKASFVLEPKVADVIADKAVTIAMEPRQGPVHIDVPISAADAPGPSAVVPDRSLATPVVPAEGADLTRARQMVAEAKRPIIVAGLDILTDGSATDLQAFAERIGAPVVTSYKAKGVLPEDHPLCLGGAGLSPLADKHLMPLFHAADLIICAGYDPIEMRTGWRNIWDTSRVNVIDISADQNHHYMHHASLNFVADTGATLRLLTDGSGVDARWPDGQVGHAKAALQAAFPIDDDWGPAAAIDVCRQVLPKGTLATADSGAHRILLSQMWRCDAPRELVQSSAFCTMGCAVPLAMGLALAAPDRTVVSFSGDGGFLMVAGELATAAELDLRPILVVFVDSSLALIELKQRQRQLANNAVDLHHHDFAAIGQAFGGVGYTVRSRDALAQALVEAQNAETFSVIAVEIDRQAYDGRI
ncbi:thiamine pyrophosphate-binding protein [Actibacterium sp. 188UL27-1]|uniref:thiamine pyrophosphate-binding protein n=1 Tax=Actibacterium sp. 188UL27-1 TaxID=2786961 RepID=UPI001959DC16|nr:thiamine pyrophosphate-binding protein [Actibacterium sp. 188UL27-1]MBM7066131.1 thiamine pyrophosphate-binding protein [Actibacterium sp. 188UL27-1]